MGDEIQPIAWLLPFAWIVKTGNDDCCKIDSVWSSKDLAQRRVTQMIAIKEVELNNKGILPPDGIEFDIDVIPYRIDKKVDCLPRYHGESYQDNANTFAAHLNSIKEI